MACCIINLLYSVSAKPDSKLTARFAAQDIAIKRNTRCVVTLCFTVVCALPYQSNLVAEQEDPGALQALYLVAHAE